jgi:alpha-galactosidase
LIRYRLGRACTRFTADVGIDDESAGRGTAQFDVWADGSKLFESGVLTGSTPPRRVDVDLTGKRDLRLFVGVGGDNYEFDHADWAGARLTCREAGATMR